MPRRRTLTVVLADALEVVELTERDQAAVRLAQEYAARLDAGEDATRLGPAYLACLKSLGMTPRARATLKTTTAPATVVSPLIGLRQQRVQRADRGAGHDSA